MASMLGLAGTPVHSQDSRSARDPRSRQPEPSASHTGTAPEKRGHTCNRRQHHDPSASLRHNTTPTFGVRLGNACKRVPRQDAQTRLGQLTSESALRFDAWLSSIVVGGPFVT
eukprot:924577-Rhodomonas_salina.2